MLRLVAAYRWEALLVVGVPAIRLAGAALVETFVDAYSGPSADVDDAASRIAVAWAAASVAAAAVAAVSYLGVRREGRPLLTLAWMYAIGNSILMTSWHIWFFEQSDSSGGLDPALRLVISASPLTLGYWALYALLIWRALRLGLSHALFLVALAHFLTGIEASIKVFWQVSIDQTAVRCLIGLAAGGAMAWLLAAFDSRAAEFRKKAVAASVIAGAAAHATIQWPVLPLWAEYRAPSELVTWVYTLGVWTLFLAESLSELVLPFALVFLVHLARRVAKGDGGASSGIEAQ